ncbi:MAG TPA: hypothetical protein VJ799_03160 [Nitrososphaeraceae archaeon]|nr:hypothetical protein [Nitrososphaeraceae archaeon]
MAVLVLLKFGLEANDSEMQVTFKPRNIRQNAILLLMVMGLYIILRLSQRRQIIHTVLYVVISSV